MGNKHNKKSAQTHAWAQSIVNNAAKVHPKSEAKDT
jgi:hypothetical protein